VLPTDPTSPPISNPSSIGPYEILGELGSGGMGRVFRARDTRLGRDVALKMLHHAGQYEPRRQQRFLDEARAAGALNHPNILAVYDVGTDRGQPYLVSELIDGLSLRRELDTGAMPMSRVLDLATQVADGLAAAHQAGLMHRDLKPENVMVARGRAKIIDFGLAKAADASGDAATHTLTAPHTILGTPPYMSPEQGRGAPLDYRSDLFSFGSMVYEMATGARAFERATPIETLTAIQHDEPPKMKDVNARVPARLQHIVERCLAKSPDDRYASTADLHHDLRDLRDGRSTTNDTPSVAPSAMRWWRRRHVPIAMLSATALGASGVAALLWIDATATVGRDLGRYRVVPVATDAGYEGSPAWSPDGRSLAYIAERDGVLQVMMRSLESSRSVQLTQAVADCRGPMWSADGSRVYYISLAGAEDSLWSVGAAGGAPRMELRRVSTATMPRDGSAVVFLRDEGAFALTLWVSAPVGTEPVKFAEGQFGIQSGMSEIRFSPDGTRIGLWGEDVDPETPDRPEFSVIDYPSGRSRVALRSLPVTSRTYPFAWMPDNRRIVFGADLLGRSPGTHLWIADTESGHVEALTASSTSEYEPSVSPDGTRVAFVADASHYDVIEIPVDGGAPVARTTNASDDSDPVWSPSGRQYAYVTNRTGRPEVWLSDVEGAVEIPVVARRNFQGDSFLISRPAVSPDAQRIVFQRIDAEGSFLWTVPMAGGQAVPTVYRSPAIAYADAPAWSPNGEWLGFLYLSPQVRGSWMLGKTRPGPGEPVVELRRDVNFLTSPQWSPDGRWITAGLQDGLYAVSPDTPEQRVISRDPWLVHTWSRDSRSIFAMRQSDDNRLQLASIDVTTQAVRVINADLGAVPPTTPPLRGFSLSPDGTRLLTSIARLRGDIHVLDGFERTDTPWTRLMVRLRGRDAAQNLSISP